MTSLSIFTSMTQPEKRKDPWNESLSCYEDFADEVVVVGENWPEEFEWGSYWKSISGRVRQIY